MAVLQRIAVADDEKIVRDFYCRVLLRQGINVVVIAQNGIELVNGCRAECPDLIICDIRMPEMDGLSAIEMISRFRPTPAIVISAASDLIEHAGNQCVLAYLIKPVGIDELEHAITFAQRQLEQETWHV